MIAFALAMKLLVPAGFMPIESGGQIVIGMCSGTGPIKMAMTIPGLKHGQSDDDGHHGKAEQPCAFSSLSAPSLAAADPIVLAAAILFATAIIRHLASPSVVVAPTHLRPPLRGPPVTA